MHLTLWLFAAFTSAGPAGQAAQPPPPTTEALPVSVDRIRKVLAEPPAITPTGAPVFRVEILGNKPNLEDFLGKDFWKGNAAPVPGGAGMTHQEFLGMVTPSDFRGTAMYTQGEAITVMATSVIFQWAIDKALQQLDKAIQKVRLAKKARAREEARQEVQDALAELDRARAAAGLAPLSALGPPRAK